MGKNKNKCSSEKEVVTLVVDLDQDDFIGHTLKENIIKINELIKNFGENARTELDYSRLILRYQRLETDDEFKERMRKEEIIKMRCKREKELKEEYERKEYIRLRKKFEKDSKI